MKTKISHFFMLTFICALSLSANAEVESCTDKISYASYTIELPHKNQKFELDLYRLDRKVGHYYSQSQITEVFELNAVNQVKTTKFFNAHERGIEYQPNESVGIAKPAIWSEKYQLISEAFLNASDKQNHEKQTCKSTTTHKVTKNDTVYTVKFNTAQSLLTHFEIKKKGQIVEKWSLQEHHPNQENVKAFFAKLDNYQTTDYADIGDDHTDPFLTTMVTQGFIEKSASGFYQMTDSQELKALDGHHHH